MRVVENNLQRRHHRDQIAGGVWRDQNAAGVGFDQHLNTGGLPCFDHRRQSFDRGAQGVRPALPGVEHAGQDKNRRRARGFGKGAGGYQVGQVLRVRWPGQVAILQVISEKVKEVGHGQWQAGGNLGAIGFRLV